LLAAITALTVTAFGVVAYRTVRASTLEAASARLRSTVTQINTIAELGAISQVDLLRTAAADPAIAQALAHPHSPVPAAAVMAMTRLRGTGEVPGVVELLAADGSRRAVLPESLAALPSSPPAPFPIAAEIGALFLQDGALAFTSRSAVVVDGAVIGGIQVTRRLAAHGGPNRRIVTNILGPSAVLLIGNADGTLWNGTHPVAYPMASESPVRYRRDGTEWISMAMRAKGTPWLYAVELPETVALAPAHALVQPFIFTGLAVAVAGALLGLHVMRRITGPLSDLTAASEAVARGDRDVPLGDLTRRDEIGRLARAFQTMAASVRGEQERLVSEVGSRTAELASAVTRQQELDQELRRSERFATLGKISGNVSHELRNPLGVMSNVVFLIDQLPDASPQLRDYSRMLREQIRLSERIISDLFDRARSGAVAVSVDVAALADELIARIDLPPGIRLARQIPVGLPAAVLDRDRVGQILWNLMTNATQAMRARGGVLTIAATIADDRLRFEISDTGPGIPAEDADRIFEPLYTTKSEGVGLGLSISRAFARAAGGDLRLERTGPAGTTFVLELPAR
jgi:signal transduction histidine kinase